MALRHGTGPGLVALLCYDGEATSWIGESLGMEGSDFVDSPGAGSDLAAGLVDALPEDDGAVTLDWLPGAAVGEGVDGSLRDLAKQK